MFVSWHWGCDTGCVIADPMGEWVPTANVASGSGMDSGTPSPRLVRKSDWREVLDCHAWRVTRIALVASRSTGAIVGDGPLLLAAFDAIGMKAEIVPWGNGPEWARFDAVVIRNTWDYVFDRDAFLKWAAEVSTCTRLANSLEVLEWNTDKRYLRELEAQGIPIAPTIWVEPGEPMPRHSWDDFVVKPSVSAGGWLSARYERGDDPGDHMHRIHATGAAAMLQPYISSIDTDGETGTYVFGGDLSHAIRKGPVLELGKPAPEDLSAGLLQSVAPAEIDPRLGAFARRVLGAAPSVLYARVDTASGVDGHPILLELEVTEPHLFLEHAPCGANRFARAVERWLQDGATGTPGDPAC